MSLIDTYLKQINERLHQCNDIELLDFIFRLLKKHSEQALEPDGSRG